MSSNLILSRATARDRHEIYAIRHQIYAAELGQHIQNSIHELKDAVDEYNHYIVARVNKEMAGFISITPPGSPKFSVDKYFDRSNVPFSFDDDLYEIRLLTVQKTNRNSHTAFALMYAAFRWVQSHGGKNIVAICRQDLIKMYVKAGMKLLEHRASSGKMIYQLAVTSTADLELKVHKHPDLYNALQKKMTWQLPYSFFSPSACYHGGSFFKAIGEDLQHLDRSNEIINADVLDAWFPPSPKVLEAFGENLSFLLKTSPPTHAEGLVRE
ncbi:MAG: GNAT family N-acetyltransferase, partial [Chitinophagaceae bacterium]